MLSTRLILCLALSLSLGACATQSAELRQVESVRIGGRDREMFATAYERVLDYYVEDVDLADLARDAAEALKTRDAGLQIDFTPAAIRIGRAGQIAGEYPRPRGSDPEQWADVTSRLVAMARALSPDLRKDSDEQIYELMMGELVGKLDPYSRYISASRALQERGRRSGYAGIGLTFEKREGQHVVVSVFEDGPAARAGLKPGDVIVSVNGQEAEPLDADQLGDRMRGEIGSRVILAIRRGTQLLPLELLRERVIPTFISTEIRDGIAIIHLSRFTTDTAERLEERFRILADRPEVRGAVLDLRGNPGGLLDQAVEVADLFLDGGAVISTRGRHPGSFQRFTARPGALAPQIPLVVLVDGRSASASEVVAAALQENGRALIAGSTSFGKGSVQTVTRLPNGGELLLTWSYIYTPKDYLLNTHGVTPYLCFVAPVESADAAVETALATKPRLMELRERGPRDPAAVEGLKETCPAKQTLPDTSLDAVVAFLGRQGAYAQALAAANRGDAIHTAALP